MRLQPELSPVEMDLLPTGNNLPYFQMNRTNALDTDHHNMDHFFEAHNNKNSFPCKFVISTDDKNGNKHLHNGACFNFIYLNASYQGR